MLKIEALYEDWSKVGTLLLKRFFYFFSLKSRIYLNQKIIEIVFIHEKTNRILWELFTPFFSKISTFV